MNSLDLYHEIWLGHGRTPFRREPPPAVTELTDPLELTIVLLLEAGGLSAMDLRRARLLYEESRREEDGDPVLALFVITMFVHLAHGHVRLRYDHESVVRPAIEYALAALCSRTAIEPETGELRDHFTRHYRTIDQNLATLVERFLKKWNSYSLIATDPAVPRPILRFGNHFYFRRYLLAEQYITSSIATRFQPPAAPPPEQVLQRILHEVFVSHGLRRGDRIVAFHPRQQAASALALLNRTMIISGGPGTGKTSVALQILRCFLRLVPDLIPEQIALTAPTGRAAARIQESIESNLRGLEWYRENATDSTGRQVIERDLSLSRIEGQTVHRLLRYSPLTATFRYNERTPLPHRLIVVDEVSMLDVALFSRLLAAIDEDTVLVLLGDRNQLPSVEAGAVLGDFTDAFYCGGNATLAATTHERLNRILPDPPGPQIVIDIPHRLRDAMIVLTHSYRSVSSIASVSAKINRADITAVDDILDAEPVDVTSGGWPIPLEPLGDEPLVGHGCRPVIAEGDEALERIVRSWVTHTYLDHAYGAKRIDGRRNRLYRAHDYGTTLQRLVDALSERDSLSITGALEFTETALAEAVFAYLEQARMLCFVKQGPFGTRTLNRRARDIVRPVFDGAGVLDCYHGMPVLITRNAHATRLYNGDIGVILKVRGVYYGLFRQAGSFRLLPRHRLPSFEPAFAMTVHKSQGSEFDTVLLVVPEGAGPLMTREILYTGLTRARLLAGVVATRQSLEECLSRSIERDSGIREFVDSPGPGSDHAQSLIFQ